MERVLSLYDVQQVPEAMAILEFGSDAELLNLFYDVGFDVFRKIYRQDDVVHRPMSIKSPVKCTRWIGYERIDPEWQESGYCTKENWLEIVGMKDRYLQDDLRKMSVYPNFTAMVIQNLRGDSTDGFPTVDLFLEEEEYAEE